MLNMVKPEDEDYKEKGIGYLTTLRDELDILKLIVGLWILF